MQGYSYTSGLLAILLAVSAALHADAESPTYTYERYESGDPTLAKQLIFTPPTVLSASLNEDNQPQGVSPNTSALVRGLGVFFYDTEEYTLKFKIVYSRLSGNLTKAQFHVGEEGKQGPVLATICGDSDAALLGACKNNGTSGTLSGEWEFPQEYLEALSNDQIYANCYTELNPLGEIRGQLKVDR